MQTGENFYRVAKIGVCFLMQTGEYYLGGGLPHANWGKLLQWRCLDYISSCKLGKILQGLRLVYVLMQTWETWGC
jgi:hypothetical protein